MVVAVAEVVLDVIALIFQGVEGLVFDLRAASAGPDHLCDIVGVHGQIGYPGCLMDDLVLGDELIVEKVHIVAFLAAVDRHLLDPALQMTASFDVHGLQSAPPWP